MKILLLTTIYPAPDLKYGTPSIHYFTKEWANMGHNVTVVHHQAIYLRVFYFLARLFRDKIASRTGAVVFTKRENEDRHYIMDNVAVHRLPIFKIFPYGRFGKAVIKKQIEKIVQLNENDRFHPDIIIGHFSNPQLEIVSKLKKVYNARASMVMHDAGKSIRKIYKKNHPDMMSVIDIWGFRSLPIKNEFEQQYGIRKRSFLCYSGIPENYILKKNTRSFTEDVSKFVYIGELIERKCPMSLISAINKVYSGKGFHISYVGKGAELAKMKSLTNSLSLNNNVSFFGHMPRNEIIAILDNSECMIMISKNETFGLVYLEAMARGCITIGSLNQGIDGVIKHGVNGFLCQEGDEKDLAKIICHINSLSSKERLKISSNAISTVEKLTDSMAANKYIKAISY
jgi:L-malate glycosyltransferase